MASAGILFGELQKRDDEIEQNIMKIRQEFTAKLPPESRVESFPFLDQLVAIAASQARAMPQLNARAQEPEEVGIQPFQPMRPFWAVVSHAGQLPGYIFLQLALDFSPAIMGLLFALLAPFPSGDTHLGRKAAELQRRLAAKLKDIAERRSKASTAGVSQENNAHSPAVPTASVTVSDSSHTPDALTDQSKPNPSS